MRHQRPFPPPAGLAGAPPRPEPHAPPRYLKVLAYSANWLGALLLAGMFAGGIVVLLGGIPSSWAAVFITESPSRPAPHRRTTGRLGNDFGNKLLEQSPPLHGFLNGMNLTIESGVVSDTLENLVAEAMEKGPGAGGVNEKASGEWPSPWAGLLSGRLGLQGPGWALVARLESESGAGVSISPDNDEPQVTPGLRERISASLRGEGLVHPGKPVFDLIIAADDTGSAPCAITRVRADELVLNNLMEPAAESSFRLLLEEWFSPLSVTLVWESSSGPGQAGVVAWMKTMDNQTAPAVGVIAERLMQAGLSATIHPTDSHYGATVIHADGNSGVTLTASEQTGAIAGWVVGLRMTSPEK